VTDKYKCPETEITFTVGEKYMCESNTSWFTITKCTDSDVYAVMGEMKANSEFRLNTQAVGSSYYRRWTKLHEVLK
jgi:hypothetical protein